MSDVIEVPLSGCRTEPLINYLKALGVFRLVAEQKDRNARGCWRDDVFVLKSALDEEALVRFFVDEYQPSPVFAPWNGDGGFLSDSGASLATINRLRTSADARLQPLASMVNRIDDVPILNSFKEARETAKALNKKKRQQKQAFSAIDAEALRAANKTVKEVKGTILSGVRTAFPDEIVRWLDACLSISSDGFIPAPLLGSGGCDGRLEFSANFLANVLMFCDLSAEESSQWVEKALFERGRTTLVPTSIGQFSPGQIGGPNATQGFEGDSFINPLDFMLTVEGAILFASSVSRRMQNGSTTKAAFPFTVFASPSGSFVNGNKESKTSRGEIWLPLWGRFASLHEISHVFSEGRAEVGRKQASSGVQFARAAVSLGVDRGIFGFARYGFLQRNGKAYLATTLGRFDVRVLSEVDLFKEADPWLDRFMKAFSGDKAPPRFDSALRRIDSAIYNFCNIGGTARFAEVLCALGSAERELSKSDGFRERLRPLRGLSGQWLRAANDNSVEFELALSLARIHDSERKVDAIRSNMEPVSGDNWKTSGFCHVWTNASLSVNLISVLQRRMIDAKKYGCGGLPLASYSSASADSVAAYIAGDVDDSKIEELLWGMILINHGASLVGEPALRVTKESPIEARDRTPIPRVYALLKLLFLSGNVEDGDRQIAIIPELPVIEFLLSGRVGTACTLAARRLKASGLIPMTYGKGRTLFREADWQSGSVDPIRLAAALLFPLSLRDRDEIKQLVIRPDNTISP